MWFGVNAQGEPRPSGPDGMSDAHRAELFSIAREIVEDATAAARAEMLEMIRRPRRPQIIMVKQPSGCAPVLWIAAILAALLFIR